MVMMMSKQAFPIVQQIPDDHDIDNENDGDGGGEVVDQFIDFNRNKKADSEMAIHPAQLTRNIKPTPSTRENRL